MFTTKGVEPQVNQNSEKSVNNYIQPGIVVASIKSVDTHTAATGNEGLRFNFIDENGAVADHVFYVIEGKDVTKEVMLDKVIQISIALGVREAVDNIQATTLKDYAMDLSDIISNKPARFKFTGVEIAGKKGNWWKSQLAFYNFVESLSTEPSQLTFDPTNTRDMKHLEIKTTDETVSDVNIGSGEDW